MEYAIQVLEEKKKQLEKMIRDQDLMHKDMRQATVYLKNISEIKKVIRLLRQKSVRS